MALAQLWSSSKLRKHHISHTKKFSCTLWLWSSGSTWVMEESIAQFWFLYSLLQMQPFYTTALTLTGDKPTADLAGNPLSEDRMLAKLWQNGPNSRDFGGLSEIPSICSNARARNLRIPVATGNTKIHHCRFIHALYTISSHGRALFFITKGTVLGGHRIRVREF